MPDLSCRFVAVRSSAGMSIGSWCFRASFAPPPPPVPLRRAASDSDSRSNSEICTFQIDFAVAIASRPLLPLREIVFVRLAAPVWTMLPRLN